MDNGQNLGSRQYTVRILSDEGHKDVTCYGGSSLMDIFRQNNIYIEAPCGGKGICGKCKVRVRNGEVSDMTHLESQFLSHKEKQDRNIGRYGSSHGELSGRSSDNVHRD